MEAVLMVVVIQQVLFQKDSHSRVRLPRPALYSRNCKIQVENTGLQ
jgi:hypothetical protein